MDKLDYDSLSTNDRERLEAAWANTQAINKWGQEIRSALLKGLVPAAIAVIGLLGSLVIGQRETTKILEDFKQAFKEQDKKVNTMWYVGGWEPSTQRPKTVTP